MILLEKNINVRVSCAIPAHDCKYVTEELLEIYILEDVVRQV